MLIFHPQRERSTFLLSMAKALGSSKGRVPSLCFLLKVLGSWLPWAVSVHYTPPTPTVMLGDSLTPDFMGQAHSWPALSLSRYVRHSKAIAAQTPALAMKSSWHMETGMTDRSPASARISTTLPPTPGEECYLV